MKLFASTTSPFARKVTLLILEKGVTDAVHIEYLDPWQMPERLVTRNPLSKVPTLVLDDGRIIIDSDVICEYLDSHLAGPRMFPAPGDGYWHTRAMAAMSNGLIEASVAVFLELKRRPAEYRWNDWVGCEQESMNRTLGEFDREVDRLSATFDYAAICVVTALGHMDFRLTSPGWHDAHPRLSAWLDAQSRRPSVAATMPAEAVA
jgi:glutathione S-transferase